jgi:hypothetical protein
MDSAIHMILHPKPTKPAPHLPSDTTDTYLCKCKQNIEAEVWSLVCNSRQSINLVTNNNNTIASASRSGARIPCDQLRYNLLVIRGSLCLATRTRADGAVMYDKGRAMSYGGTCLVGYVKPYVYEYAAIVGYINSGATVPSILKDIALLGSQRTPFPYERRPFSDAVASNALQRQGVLGLAHTVEGIQGPPGTGKSSTIFHIVHSAMPSGMVAIITCVQNRAVDALACKFQSSSVGFIVLGSPDRLGDTAKKFALESRVEAEANVALQRGVLEWVARVLELLHIARRKREASRQFKSAGWRRWWVLYSRRPLLMADLEQWSARYEAEEKVLNELRLLASQSIASDAVVVLCTVDALCRVEKLQTRTKKRRILIIDEAGTVPEYKIPLAVSLGVEAVIAVGDQNQLQPFTHTGVSNGFFHRLARAVPPSMLEEQFRMHPEISGFVSSSFYGGRLYTNHAIASARTSVPHSGVFWVDYADQHAESNKKGGALCNEVEVGMVKRFLVESANHLLSEGKTILLIAFYREQFHLLMLLGEKLGFVGSRLQGTKTERYFVHPGFRICTVDASQGSESDIVVLSCVRCNHKHEIGFLAHPNRVCVALSRARERLVVVGSSKTLTAKSGMWGALFAASFITPSVSCSTAVHDTPGMLEGPIPECSPCGSSACRSLPS